MNVFDQKLQSFQSLDCNLRSITEVFALELANPSATQPALSPLQCRIARAVVAIQGVAPLLSVRSSWEIDSEWSQFLSDQREHVLRRHRRIESLLVEIDSRARQSNICLLGLKGVALHRLGLYIAGERPMADIDFLTPDKDLRCARKVLEECGFEITFANSRHDLFELRAEQGVGSRFGESANNPIKIELHSDIRERLPVSEVKITEFLFPVDVSCGITSYRSRAALMMHLLLHAAGNMRANALRQIQLHDIASLASLLTSEDWDELLIAQPSGQSIWWAAPPLALTRKYYPWAIPEDVVRRASEKCSWVLRKRIVRWRLADVSWSNIRVYALPGFEWCANPAALLKFFFERLFPNAEVRSNLRHFGSHAQDRAAAKWYGSSQTSRLMRWTFSRPLRVQTLMAVRAALSQSNQRI